MNVRIKLRKNQSTIPSEKLTPEITSLEIIGDSIQKIPSLSHLKSCQYLSLNAPELIQLNELPPNLTVLKLRGTRTIPQDLPCIHTLGLSYIQLTPFPLDFKIPTSVLTLNLNGNKLSEIPEGLFDCVNLQRLNLDNNEIVSLPSRFFEIKDLVHLSLDNNPLSDDCKNKLYQKYGIWF